MVTLCSSYVPLGKRASDDFMKIFNGFRFVLFNVNETEYEMMIYFIRRERTERHSPNAALLSLYAPLS